MAPVRQEAQIRPARGATVKTGIIGLPQVGKTSLFKILTKARLDAHAMHSRDAHVGVARVPDERLDRLSALRCASRARTTSSRTATS